MKKKVKLNRIKVSMYNLNMSPLDLTENKKYSNMDSGAGVTSDLTKVISGFRNGRDDNPGVHPVS